jgi:hypothetical protein
MRLGLAKVLGAKPRDITTPPVIRLEVPPVQLLNHQGFEVDDYEPEVPSARLSRLRE